MNLDRILDLLSDGQWHDVEDVSNKTKIRSEKVQKVFDFLAEFGFIEKDGAKIKLQSALIEIEEVAQ